MTRDLVEVVSRIVRDLDDGGRLLWIPESKTEAGRRTLVVPDMLRPLLTSLAEGKMSTALLDSGELRVAESPTSSSGTCDNAEPS